MPARLLCPPLPGRANTLRGARLGNARLWSAPCAHASPGTVRPRPGTPQPGISVVRWLLCRMISIVQAGSRCWRCLESRPEPLSAS